MEIFWKVKSKMSWRAFLYVLRSISKLIRMQCKLPWLKVSDKRINVNKMSFVNVPVMLKIYSAINRLLRVQSL